MAPGRPRGGSRWTAALLLRRSQKSFHMAIMKSDRLARKVAIDANAAISRRRSVIRSLPCSLCLYFVLISYSESTQEQTVNENSFRLTFSTGSMAIAKLLSRLRNSGQAPPLAIVDFYFSGCRFRAILIAVFTPDRAAPSTGIIIPASCLEPATETRLVVPSANASQTMRAKP